MRCAHQGHSQLPEAENWWERMLRKQPLRCSVATAELCQPWEGNRVLARAESFRDSAAPTDHSPWEETLALATSRASPALLAPLQPQCCTARGAKLMQEQAKEAKPNEHGNELLHFSLPLVNPSLSSIMPYGNTSISPGRSTARSLTERARAHQPSVSPTLSYHSPIASSFGANPPTAASRIFIS